MPTEIWGLELTDQKWILISGLFLALTLMVILFLIIRKKSSQSKISAATSETLKTSSVEKKIPIEISFAERLKKGLSKSRTEIWDKLEKIVGGHAIEKEQIEQIEELLYSSDIGTQTVQELVQELNRQKKSEIHSVADLKNFLFNFLNLRMQEIQKKIDPRLLAFNPGATASTQVIMVVGVNGAGKTTTIGKLATKLTKQGAKVVVAACDTFRAAAVDQLQIWCDRAGAQMVRAKEGADPSGVAYDALEKARSQKADYCIIDTAGRLHTKTNLMEELQKNKRVLSKLDTTAPHQVLLVIDAITGQNAFKQAEEFNKALGLTGLVFTKCDGSAKAGNAVSIVQKLNVPIAYIGVGESVEDLDVFHLPDYLRALLNMEGV
jgi:fused signal recognition particle receptor